MLIHLARVSVITIALSLVGGVGYLLSRPSSPTVITVVVPPSAPAIVAQPAATAPTTIVQPAVVHPYWWSSAYYHPAWCGRGWCY
jgi:hypothetical protein